MNRMLKIACSIYAVGAMSVVASVLIERNVAMALGVFGLLCFFPAMVTFISWVCDE